MQTLYPYFLSIHLLCAIIFLGFIFSDVLLLSILEKQLGKDALEPMMKRGRKIMPSCVILLVITGTAMMTKYLDFRGGVEGFFGTPLQTFLSVKIILALIIVCLVINAFFHRLVLKKPNPLGDYTHIIALVLGFFIVVFAKFAFYVWVFCVGEL